MRGGFLRHALPPNVAIIGQGHVGKDHVGMQGRHGVRIGLVARPGGDAKIARLRVDGIQTHLPGHRVRARPDPSDIVADRRDFPAIEARRWNQHGEIGLATRRRESRCDVLLLPARAGDAQDQHMLRQPTHPILVSGRPAHVRGDSQCEALLPEQGIATIARAK